MPWSQPRRSHQSCILGCWRRAADLSPGSVLHPSSHGGQVRGPKLLWGEASTSPLLALHHLARTGLIPHRNYPRRWVTASGCRHWKEAMPAGHGKRRRKKRRRKEPGNGHGSKCCPKHDALRSFSRGPSRSSKVCVKSVTLVKVVTIVACGDERQPPSSPP